jgi:cytochrome P450
VAIKDFTYGDFKVKEGGVALIQIKDNPESQCIHYKNLSFGFRTHYCSGALMSRAIIAIVVPAFFRIYPNATVQAWKYDSSIHTATALTTLKVNIK